MDANPARKKRKSTGNGRDSDKLDQLIEVVSRLSDEVNSLKSENDEMHKHMKETDRKLLRILNLLEEAQARNPPAAVPSSDFQASCCCRSSLNQAESAKPTTTTLHLSFVCRLPPKLFTANLIYAIADSDGTETNVPLRIALLDESGNVITETPLSSLKLELYVAYGDFEADDWTAKELETSRVPAREDKGSLLLGCCVGKMENGICTFNELKFGDNSSWVRSKKFKLVAKVAEGARLPDMVDIRPAISGPFSVKDQRGKQYEKHSVPSPDDEVWRLNRIGKDGPYHKKLEENGIKTVKDFLQRYNIDQSSLHKIIGAKDGTWATIVENAKECNPNNEGFQYSSHESKFELLFNCFYKLVSVSFDNRNAVSLETLGESDKRQVEQLRRRAFEDETKLVRINSLTGWPSAKAIPLDSIKTQHPPQQGQGKLGNEFLENVPCYPQTPLFIIGDLLQDDEPPAQCNAAIDDFSFMESDPSFWDTLPVDYEHHPFQNPL